MPTKQACCIGLAVALALVLIAVVYRSRAAPAGGFTPSPAGRRGARRERFEGGGGARGPRLSQRELTRLRNTRFLPYTAIQNKVDSVVGNPDAEDILKSPARMEAYYRSQAMITPEEMMSAERAMWVQAADQDRTAPYNVERMSEPADDTMQAHSTAPALNYQDMITDLVVDPRTRENHGLWVNEMKGWSGTTTMKVDTFEPELYLNWQGLRMPQAGVGQYNPMQLTEVDDSMLARNHRFNFQG